MMPTMRACGSESWRRIVGLAVVCLTALLCAPLLADSQDARRTVTFWNLFTTGESLDTIAELIKRFNDASPSYIVRRIDIPYGQVHQKMLAAIAGNVPPDCSIFDRFLVGSYAARNAFTALDDLAQRDAVKGADFFDAPWAECIYNGRQYAVPYDTDVRVLYYNKALFRKAGLDPERPPKTWKELREVSRRLTVRRTNGTLEQAGYLPIYGNTTLYLYGWQKGGEFVSADGLRVTLNDPKIVQALAWLKEFSDEYGVENMMSFQSGFGWTTQNPFVTGKLAMVVWDVGAITDIKKYGPDLDFGVAPCPYADDGIPATWSGGFAMVIPRGARESAGAWELAKFILSEPSQRYMATSSYKLPARRSAANDPFFQNSDFWRLAIDEMKHSRYRPVSPVGAALITEMQSALDHVLYNKLTPAQAMDTANGEAQKLLDRFLQGERGTTVNWPVLGGALAGAIGLLLLVRGWFSLRQVRAMRLQRRQALAGYAFALPAMLGLGIFTLGPVVMVLVYSFTRYEVLTPATWAGVSNYQRLFTEDRYFLTALWNTLYYVAFSVPLGTAMALGLAMLLNRPIAGRPVYRALFYMPVVMPLVAGSLLWGWLFNGDYGLINAVLSHIPYMPHIPWLTSEYCSKPALILMNLWGIGGGMIIFLAALQGVPASLYEAAEIDGAGRWCRFRHITLPMISPGMFFMVVMGIIGGLQVFDQAYLMTEGGPVNSTLFYILYLYREGFENLRMGYASAMGWVLFVFILALTGIQFALARRWVYYEGAQR